MLKFDRVPKNNVIALFKPKHIPSDMTPAEIHETYREIMALSSMGKQKRALETWEAYWAKSCKVPLCLDCLDENGTW